MRPLGQIPPIPGPGRAALPRRSSVYEKIKEPKLGPKYCFGEEDHITLDPYLTDVQVIEHIDKLIK